MRKPSRKEVLDAMTCDSSMEGCDGDWRRWVLDNADSEDIAFVKEQLKTNLPKEIRTDGRS